MSTEPSTDTRVTGLLPVPILNQISTSPVDGTAVDKHANTPPDGPPFKRRRYNFFIFTSCPANCPMF